MAIGSVQPVDLNGRRSRDRQTLKLADEARDRRDWPTASSHYKAYLERNPNAFHIWVQLGHALKESGRRAAALAAYSEALGQDPDNADLLLNLGHLLKVMGHPEQAIGFYRRSAHIDPTPAVLGELAAVGAPFDRNDQTEGPKPATRRTPSLRQRLAGGRDALRRGNEARDRRDWPGAAQAYKAYLAANPGKFPIWVQLGHALKESGQFDEALSAYQTALKLDGQNPDLLLNLGHLHKLRGARNHAIQYYRQSAVIDQNEHAVFELSRLELSTPPRQYNPAPAPAFDRASLDAAAQPEVAPPIIVTSGADSHSALLENSPLFDRNYYLELYPDIAQAGIDPLMHFLNHGGQEGRSPHPLFDSNYYLNNAPDVVRRGTNPLVHYITQGEAEGRNPCVEFDVTWYRTQYGKRVGSDGTLLEHFLKNGGVTTNPSPRFDAIGYLTENPDVFRASLNPLVHYNLYGISEGRCARVVRGFDDYYPPCTDARLLEVKNELTSTPRVALLVTHSGNGLIKGYVEHYIDALRRNNIEVVLIVAASQARTAIASSLLDKCAAVYVRENVGFDFSAWAHVMARLRVALSSETLYLLNDSIIGPIGDQEFSDLLSTIDENPNNIVGLTENYRRVWHIQSFFLAIKKAALSTYGFQQFFGEIVSFENKDDVIESYEINFSPRMRERGISCGSLFGRPQGEELDDTIHNWRSLVQRGMPFVKRSLISGDHRAKGGDPVVLALRESGYPIELLRLENDYAVRTAPHIVANLRENGEAFVEQSNVESVDHTDYRQINRRHEVKPENIRVTLISPSNFANGLGAAARGYISALLHTKLVCNFHPIKRPFHIHARLTPTWEVSSSPGAPDVVIVHLNPDAWHGLLTPGDRKLIASAGRRVGIFVWELSIVPDDWLPALNLMDAIIVPSEYCAQIVRRVADVPVYVVPHVVALPHLRSSGADTHGEGALLASPWVPDDRRMILYAFDGSSFLDRKNPFALVRAFKRSGLGKTPNGWRLVLKTKHLFDMKTEGDRLLREIGGDSSITLIDRVMTPHEMADLFRRAEIYASPHSSEGFGLTIAEAMAMGKVVVATNFGGSMDFLDESTGFPVLASEAELTETYGPYVKGGVWGKVDEEALRHALEAAASETLKCPQGAVTPIGGRARQRIGAQLSAAAVGARLEAVVLSVFRDPQISDRSVEV
jgi:tetratricopeptide (TPR) repeat protein/glycosyltransferase involved in cell wall biosynthesis